MTYFKTEDQKKQLDAYVAKVVAEAPPLSPEQRDRLAMLFRAGNSGPVHIPDSPEVIARRRANEALAKVRQAFKDAMEGCHGCGLSRKVHSYQQRYTTGYHDFVDLSPDGAIKVAQVYKKKIAAAEKVLAAAVAA
ncbi:MAG: hypothetical protein M3536_08585 [Actinomycetota bacterium]|nr:hypothetical protein [Actinomycetota bacterium]